MSDTNDSNTSYGVVSQFQRNNYFYSKLMAVRDFEDEQHYMNDKRHLLNRMINGFGIVCGLEEVGTPISDGNIKIKFNSGGMAIDRQGREIAFPVGLEKDVLLKKPPDEGSQDTYIPLNVDSMGNDVYYLYLEYKEGKSEMVIAVSDDSGSQESCSYNRVIEDFQVVASEEEPKVPTISCPPPYSDDITAEIDKQGVKEWLQKETSNLCSTPEEERVFILALKLVEQDETSSAGPVVDPVETANHLSFVANNRVLSELLACHLADFTNPHNVKMSQLEDFNANNHKITNLIDPTEDKDAANKIYVDEKIADAEKTGGTVSSSSDIENVTTEHTRQLNVSYNSTASGDRSQVNASVRSTASGRRSQVNASVRSTASGIRSQVNASRRSEASHTSSQVNASLRVKSGKDYTVCGGYTYKTEGGPSRGNRKWELNSQNGDFTYLGTLRTTLSGYGEYFENLIKGVIDMGVLIALEGANVRPAKKDEDFIGVVSGTAAIRLGDSPFCWQGRYMKDEWGRPVYEEIKDPEWEPKTVPDEKWKPKKGQTEADRPMIPIETEKDRPIIRVQKENPDYDPKRKQEPRSERPKEWTLVGLLGQVYVRCDDTVKPGDFVKSGSKGIGTMSEEKTKLRAMKVTKAFDGNYAIVYCLLK
ncbi:MAG: hypothetical protein GTO45_24220 [Candidatus Aminicenantes bacterium]|nr:hypothetical protein [Candidatus Aminicenantes bacterium]NIM81859.1 hypothetical protein [Candidatus Aminicenantes bacterium]NIN21236.1 hypothetical protein [Candidatus Aminicenantes bacterium]NIN45057.1 hypothetical protein [Candidatus Aminicenantes bacterium]NIN87874.1 hypothetical protein [Candidatus Aminicenantes bacterium]